eukprot:COSAG01_NODE_1651_length_9623_cov_6.232045_1_plen_155_part_00
MVVLLLLLQAVGCGAAADGGSSPSAVPTAAAWGGGDDLAWVNHPSQWHQQAARIVDHRFRSFPELLTFARDAKQAGASVLMLVQVQKTAACPGSWYSGLQLCDHINGSYPAADGSLAEWRAMLEEIKPMRLMWWTNLECVPAQTQCACALLVST